MTGQEGATDTDIIPEYANRFGSSPAVTENYIYTGNFNGEVLALSRDGDKEWGYSTDGHVRSSPTIADDNILIGSYDYSLYNIDRFSGSLNWKFDTGGFIYSSPTVVDGQVYFGSLDFNSRSEELSYAVDLESGESEWTLEIDGIAGTTIVHSDDLFFGTWEGTVYRVTTGGSVVWTKEVEGDVAGSTATDGTHLIVPTRDGRLYSINNESGSVEWEFKANDEFYGVTPVIADGVVYVGNNGPQYTYGD
ncbi:MAG: PQQ-binding-like beta-propeller repeat protein [Natrialbaceae archaeon]|nr:PQQ-binding-like beta-propeller repeat protein [Natrialbaceae archaeon]